MSNDLFADLLGGSAKKKKGINMSSLSMSQRMKLSSSSVHTNGLSGGSSVNLDYLSAPQSTTNNANSSGSVSSSLVDDMLGLTIPTRAAAPAPAQAPAPAPPQSQSASSSDHTADLLEGFFTSAVPIQNTKPQVQPERPQTQPAKPAQPQRTQPRRQPQRISVPKEDLRDRALAELVEMGFPAEKAALALHRTSTGHDINEAISLLTRGQQASRRHEPGREESGGEDFRAVMDTLSDDLMSKASILFRTGKKRLQEGIEKYNQRDASDGLPQWARNREFYLAKERERERRRGRFQKPMSAERWDDELVDEEEARVETQVEERQRPRTPARSQTRVRTESHPQSVSQPAPAPVQVQPLTQHTDNSMGTLLDFGDGSSAASQSTLIAPLGYASKTEYTTSRANGTERFKAGDFSTALIYYQQAFSALPQDHPYRIIMLSNLATVYGKLGNFKKQLASATEGLEMLDAMVKEPSELDQVNIEGGKSALSFWVKLLTRKAEALEQSEKFAEALKEYNVLIQRGYSSKTIMDGRRRCRDVVEPKARPRPQRVARPAKPVQPTPSRPSTAAKEKQAENQKFLLHDKVEALLNSWAGSNKDNIRALLCSLEKVLWPELNWKPVNMADLVLDKKVKIVYMKAVSRVHPDKIARETSLERQMVANGVFITLNEAWEKYKQDNNMS